MSTTVGFYVHDHGDGHRRRSLAVAEALRRARPATRIVMASSGPRPGLDDCTVLGPDVDAGPRPQADAGGSLHHAPLRPDLLAPRARRLVEWLERHRPDVVVVDVSVEVAVQVRLAGTAVVVVRLAGDRTDPAHELAHRLAAAIVVPCRRSLDAYATAVGFEDKTVHCGAIGPDTATTRPAPAPRGRPHALIVWGRGSPPPPGPILDRMALATPHWDWTLVGPPTPVRSTTIVRHRGWIEDQAELAALVASAHVVVGPTGNGVVSLAVRAGRPFVAVPQDRPFREQHEHAAQLEQAGIATVVDSWPPPDRWPALLEAGRARSPADPDPLVSVGAADRAARAILAVADDPAGALAQPEMVQSV